MRENQRPYTYVGLGGVENGHMMGVGWVLWRTVYLWNNRKLGLNVINWPSHSSKINSSTLLIPFSQFLVPPHAQVHYFQSNKSQLQSNATLDNMSSRTLTIEETFSAPKYQIENHSIDYKLKNKAELTRILRIKSILLPESNKDMGTKAQGSWGRFGWNIGHFIEFG